MPKYTTGAWSRRMNYDHSLIPDEEWDEIKRKARHELNLGVNELITSLLQAFRKNQLTIK